MLCIRVLLIKSYIKTQSKTMDFLQHFTANVIIFNGFLWFYKGLINNLLTIKKVLVPKFVTGSLNCCALTCVKCF